MEDLKMKIKNFTFTGLLLITLTTGQAFAQDETMYVEPGENTLIEQIAADTSATGEQLHKVYELKNGGLYTILETVNIKNPITIKAENPVDTDNAPARVRSGVDEEGGLGTGILMTTFADLTIKDVFFGGFTPGGEAQAWGHWLTVAKPGVRIHLDGVMWDYTGWSPIHCPVENTTWIMENLHVRNSTHPGSEFVDWAITFEQNNTDTLIIRNSTFYNKNGFLFKGRFMFFDHLEIDHVTMVNSAKWPLHYHWYRDAKITNSIFYNMNGYGDVLSEREGQDPDGQQFGIINIDTLPPDTGSVSGYIIPEADRKLLVKNNLYYWTQDVKDFWNSVDSINPAVWMNERTLAMFADDDNYPGLVEENTYNEDPGFANEPSDTAMIRWTETRRSGGESYHWGYEPDGKKELLDWPIPEDLSYSADLTGTDGFHIGDLNWFPSELEAYNNPTSVFNLVNNEFSLQVYPNPASSFIQISYVLENNSNVNITLYDIVGKKIKKVHKGLNSPAGTNVISLNAKQLNPGIYLLKLNVDNRTVLKKVVIKR